ncbi:MAG: glycine zipper domain-containing protein [Verrucomicrobiota bacterium]
MITIRHSLLVAAVAGMLFSGCATDTGRKTAVGAGIGAAVGAIIGNQSGEAKKGALLGAGVGGLIGAGVSKAKEREATKLKE